MWSVNCCHPRAGDMFDVRRGGGAEIKPDNGCLILPNWRFIVPLHPKHHVFEDWKQNCMQVEGRSASKLLWHIYSAWSWCQDHIQGCKVDKKIKKLWEWHSSQMWRSTSHLSQLQIILWKIVDSLIFSVRWVCHVLWWTALLCHVHFFFLRVFLFIFYIY